MSAGSAAPLDPEARDLDRGGGFVRGDLDTHDPLCRGLAGAAGATVLSVAYRRAPEHPFPAAVQDAVAATAGPSAAAPGQSPSAATAPAATSRPSPHSQSDTTDCLRRSS